MVIVGDFPLNKSHIRGGVQAAFAYLVKGLSRIEEVELHVFTFGRSNYTGPDQIEGDGFRLHLLPHFPRFERVWNYQRYQFTLNQKLAQVRPTVIHAQDTTAHAYVALRTDYPTVVTAHGIRHEDGKYYGSFSRRLRNYFDSLWVERQIMHRTRHLIAISRYVTSYFARQLAPSLQVYYIPNAIDENFFNLTSTANGNTILFAGRVIPRKRVLDLVQAFVRLAPDFPKIQLRIAGECESEPAYVDSIRGLIKKFGLEGRVHLLGQLSEADILAEFARSDLFVLPSAQETTPMVIAQAMAAGKPVIATAVGGVAEMVSHGKTGFLIKVDNQDELANAMQSLIQDSSLRAQMGRAGHEVALQKYHLDTVAKQTYEVYKMMLKA